MARLVERVEGVDVVGEQRAVLCVAGGGTW